MNYDKYMIALLDGNPTIDNTNCAVMTGEMDICNEDTVRSFCKIFMVARYQCQDTKDLMSTININIRLDMVATLLASYVGHFDQVSASVFDADHLFDADDDTVDARVRWSDQFKDDIAEILIKTL